MNRLIVNSILVLGLGGGTLSPAPPSATKTGWGLVVC